jgi:CRISPR-associated protein Cas1
MGFRTVVIANRCKLEVSLDYLVVRGDKETKIHLSEVSLLVIQSTAVALTAALLCELSKRKIRTILCDEKFQPYGEIMPYYQGYHNSLMIKQQINWRVNTVQKVWKEVVIHKILNQMENLKRRGFSEEAEMLKQYSLDVMDDDISNREGHAAKVYFNKIFGPGFSRDKDCFINKCLNYGYSIVLSSVNRSVNSLGYLTQLGIHHCNEFNAYNLSCDLMEPFRAYVDWTVINIKDNDPDFKHILSDILNKQIVIKHQTTTLDNAIDIYVSSVLSSLSSDDVEIDFPESYEL